MSSLRAWGLRFSGLFGKERKDRELTEELESHLQMHIEDNLRAGMNPGEARRNALIKMGGIEQTKEKYRERRGLPFVESLLKDLRFGLRMLRKSPGFTTVAVLTLALGIGPNAAIFSVVNAALLRSLPFRTSNRLVAIQKVTTRHQQTWVSYPDFLDWERENHSLEAVAIWRDATLNLSIDGKTQQLTGKMVSSTFFLALGVQPILGRNFASDEDRLGAEPVVLLSEGVWRSRFGAASDIVGQDIVLDGRDCAVIGIMPSSFRFPRSQWAGTQLDADDVFTPIGQWDNKAFRDRSVSMGTWVIGLLKPNVTLSQASADLDVLGRKLATDYPEADGDTTISPIPLRKDIVGYLQPMLFILLGAVGFVLLIACANVQH